MPLKTSFNTSTVFDLSSESFEVESQFIVFTGTTISGKTEVLKALGVPFYEEVARIYLENEVAKGRTKEEIRADEGEFQRGLVETKLEIEQAAPKDSLQWFDRAMPDSITYFRAAGVDPTPILSFCKKIKYRAVFHFDPLPDQVVEQVMRRDSVRTEDYATRELIDQWLEKDYLALGLPVVRVPVMSVLDRTEFVVEVLNRSGIKIR